MFRILFLVMTMVFTLGLTPSLRAEVQSIDVVVVPYEKLPSYGSVVSAWYKQPVYDPSEKKLGVIGDMLFSPDGTINAVLLNVGGFLGIGTKHVAVPVSCYYHHIKK